MPTPKDTPYKLRQQEFRKLNSKRWTYEVPAGVTPKDYFPALTEIKHKALYVGKKGV